MGEAHSRHLLERTAYCVLLLLVFLLPLAVVPWAFDSFVTSKETLFAITVSILAVVTISAAALGSPLRIHTTPVNGLAVLLLLWMGVSTLWSAAPVLSLEETGRTGYLILFLSLFQSLVSRRRGRLLPVVYTLALASLLVTLWTLFQDFRAGFAPASIHVRQTLGDWRDSLSAVALGNTSHLGDFLVAGFFLWLGIFFLGRGRLVKMLSMASLWLHAAGLIVVWSVHSNLSLILSVVLLGFLLRDYFGREELRRIGRRFGILAAGWALVVAFYVVDHPLNPHGSAVWGPRTEALYQQSGLPNPEGGFHGGIFAQAFSSPRWVAGLDTRLAIWGTSLEIVRTNTWFGSGAGTFTWMFPATRSPIVENSPDLAQYASVWTNAAHNEPLQFWSELGIIGLSLLVLLVAVSLKRSWERLEAGVSPGNAVILAVGMTMLVAQCLQAQMNFPLQLPVSSMLFVMLLAVPYILPRRGDEEAELLVPVERGYGPVRLGVTMRNMAWPSEIGLSIRDGAALSALTITGVILISGLLIFRATNRLRADIDFRSAYDAKQLASAGITGWDPVVVASRNALDKWPRHSDALSTIQDALLRLGEFQEVIDLTPRVLEKLNSVEVYQRRADALMQRGRDAEATPDLDEIFTRRPDLGAYYPRQFEDFRRRMQESASIAP